MLSNIINMHIKAFDKWGGGGNFKQRLKFNNETLRNMDVRKIQNY